ncbi:MAG TPA: hypothetical protein VG013_02430 [Gemmataceae bacterium]|jgi:hypothetical protein|nr:hypothetical protein [Gemmataceae bacterium]
MAFRFFTIPIQNAEPAEAELNGFLRSHKVLSIDRRWVEQGPTSFWTFCVDYVDVQAAGSGGDRGGSWNNDAGNCRAANRNRNTPDNRNNNLGFRLARAPQVERMLCPTEPTAFPVLLPSKGSGQIVSLPPSSAGSKCEGSGRSFLA